MRYGIIFHKVGKSRAIIYLQEKHLLRGLEKTGRNHYWNQDLFISSLGVYQLCRFYTLSRLLLSWSIFCSRLSPPIDTPTPIQCYQQTPNSLRSRSRIRLFYRNLCNCLSRSNGMETIQCDLHCACLYELQDIRL